MREKTNSITRLVKAVAEEVFEKKMAQHQNELQTWLQKSFAQARAGEPWGQIEDDLLIQEIEHAIERIAKKHGRTIGTIRSRISQREIF